MPIGVPKVAYRLPGEATPQWVDLYNQVIPGTLHHLNIGFIEIGSFLGFIGLFAFLIARSLSKVPLVAKNHPYLDECIEHH